MAEEKEASRVKVEDLPKPEKELTAKEQKNVQGGISGFGFGTGAPSSVHPSGDTGGDIPTEH